MMETLLIIIILILLLKGNGSNERKRTGRNVHCTPVKFKKPPIPKKAFGMNVKNKENNKEETHENNCRKK